jgi:hypothetical protein
VRRSDRHAWPIIRGAGEELPGAQRLQLHSAFWHVAYHALFFLDHYLAGGVGQPNPPAPFRGDDQDLHALPHREYSREELLGYVDHCRRKLDNVLSELTEGRALAPARIGRPFLDLLIGNLVQLCEHTAQLQVFLNTRAGWSDPRWTPQDRWFRRCPHCE